MVWSSFLKRQPSLSTMTNVLTYIRCLLSRKTSGVWKNEGAVKRHPLPLFYHIEVMPVQHQQQKIINLKVFHLSVKQLLSLFPVFHFFSAVTEFPHDRVVSSNKNHPVKSSFPNEMGLNMDFSVRIPLLTVLHTTTAVSFWFAIRVVTLSLGNLMASISSWCPCGWTDLWCSVRFVQHPLGLLPPQLTCLLEDSI